MQTTLLGIAIAIILALVTALVGPHFRRLEQVSRRVRDAGEPAHRPAGARCRADRCPAPADADADLADDRHFAPGRRRRGARAQARHRVLAQLARCAANGGRPTCGSKAPNSRSGSTHPAISTGRRLDRLRPGRALDRTSRYRRTAAPCLPTPRVARGLVLENLEFKGELRSLAGPIKGEGSFVIAGQHYPYRISAEPRRRRRRRAGAASASIRSTAP